MRLDLLFGWTNEQFAEAAVLFEQRNGWLPMPDTMGAHEVMTFWDTHRTTPPMGQLHIVIDEWLRPVHLLNRQWSNRAFRKAAIECKA